MSVADYSLNATVPGNILNCMSVADYSLNTTAPGGGAAGTLPNLCNPARSVDLGRTELKYNIYHYQ